MKAIVERIPLKARPILRPVETSPAAGASARLDLYAIMTLLLLLVYPSSFWYVRIPLTVLCVSAFVFSSLRFDPRFWFVTAMVVMAGN
ncbi:MAG TPA: hypothetical protein VLB87_12430, partial [Pyrinomonadaceae bacterium]|nr:hypothetical protein [Pyrinomonadaceae bacterium]